MIERQATDVTGEQCKQVCDRIEVEVFGIDGAAQSTFRLATNRKQQQYDLDWESRKGPALQRRLESECFHFGKPKMHLVSHYREFITQMGTTNNFTTDISELLHISNV